MWLGAGEISAKTFLLGENETLICRSGKHKYGTAEVELKLKDKIETCPVDGCTNLNLHKFLSTRFNTDGCIRIRDRLNLF